MNNRKQMGFTQEELAVILRVDRTVLAKVEKGKRELPYRSLAEWSTLKRCVENAEAMDSMITSIVLQHQERLSQYVTKQRLYLEHAAYLMQQKLDRMKTQYQQCVKELAFVATLRGQGPLPENMEVSVGRLEARAMKRNWACGPDKQVALSIGIAAMTYVQQELDVLQQRIS